MVENQDIHGSILAIMESMRQQGTSPSSLKNHQNAYNVFERYLSDNCISRIDETICLEYVYAKTGQRFERFECVTSNRRVDYRMRPVLLLLRYLQDGQFHSDVWSKDDVKKLLCAIDRADPKGKRDYAILMIAIRLGLRIGDIRSLKKSSIDWNRNTINLRMAKTGQPIELPLLKDVGWAIIDYLQNGRPVTNSNRLFVRHKAPFNAFGDRNGFNKERHRYILKRWDISPSTPQAYI